MNIGAILFIYLSIPHADKSLAELGC